MSGPAALNELGLTPELLERLRALVMQSRAPLPGPGAGRRRSPRSGASVELLDYRNYVPGDDLRRLDWNVYARLDSLFTRVFRAEENLAVHLLLDRTASMAWDPPKWQTGRGLVAALGATALFGGDRLAVSALGGERLQALPPTGGEGGLHRVAAFLGALQPDGRGPLERHLAEALGARRERGLAILVSDGLLEGGAIPLLKRLLAAGHQVTFLQVLSPAEREPEGEGDWRLTDVEGHGAEIEVSLGPATLRLYKERLGAELDAVASFCRRHGVGYWLVPAELGVADSALLLLRGRLLV
ncbi:MAG TPA: DUF58 domain-containing protein [Symbiobacteriaceae bacterium]|nr:DUF58 domain-containing protein [Symbiobacteriaceae bacterium]